MSEIFPVKNCKVKLLNGDIGLVKDIRSNQSCKTVLIRLADSTQDWVNVNTIESGYSISNYVYHSPINGSGKSLGFGRIIGERKQFGLTLVLVCFADSGESRWLDWRTLAQAHPVEQRIARRIVGRQQNHAEHFRLRILSKSLQIWDMNTGALARLDIDPLPHQLDVARKVVSAPRARFILSDDVGLGKTIEVGLILHALEQRNRCRRVLIICPASLTKQWKEEMRFKFSRSFEILNRDFTPEFSDEMRSRECVIVSLDLAKKDKYLSMLMQAGQWDVTIFDEAHRLGKGDRGEQTERYKLGLALRDQSAAMLLLTATPHQGKTRKFAALLELARPDLKSKINTLEINPEIVGEIVIRNKKSKVTDAEGNLLFRGHDTMRILVDKNDAMGAADKALTSYLRAGYRAGQLASDANKGRAIGFVMSTYRKLASSSVAAILTALERRLHRLVDGEINSKIITSEILDVEDDDDLTQSSLITDIPVFFQDELLQLKTVISKFKKALETDNKLDVFVNEIISKLITNKQNVLIFTEYRATQEYLKNKLKLKFPDIANIELINGSMSLDQKMESVFRFNNSNNQILISTEAGGEGLNLQKSCHIMVNYDLPWNPSRLVQRIGRLYRYGQTKRVQVINLQSNDSFDNQALNLMMDRVTTMATDMAAVSKENQEALAADILGEILSNIDMEEILIRAENMTISRTESQILEAIENARQSRELEEDILQYSSNFSTRVQGGFDHRHIISFVEGMAAILGIELKEKLHKGLTLEFSLPEEMIGRWPEFGRKRVIRLSVDQDRVRSNPDLVPLDFECSFVLELASLAQDRIDFDGLYAESPDQELATYLTLHQVRWQDAQGAMLEEELIPIGFKNEKFYKIDFKDFTQSLLSSWRSNNRETTVDPENNAVLIAKAISPAIDQILKPDVAIHKFPSSIFTFAACKQSQLD